MPDSNTNSSPPSSPATDESSEIDELDHRSRKLTKLLKRTAKKADSRKELLNHVRDKAWVLEDQVNLLEKQTKKIKESLADKSTRRNIVVFTVILSSVTLLGFGIKHAVQQQSEYHLDE